jgi:hypothetical protein
MTPCGMQQQLISSSRKALKLPYQAGQAQGNVTPTVTYFLKVRFCSRMALGSCMWCVGFVTPRPSGCPHTSSCRGHLGC